MKGEPGDLFENQAEDQVKISDVGEGVHRPSLSPWPGLLCIAVYRNCILLINHIKNQIFDNFFQQIQTET